MNDKAKSRMYGLTSIASLAWTIQTIYQSVQKGQLWTWLNLVFYTSMALVILYTAYSSFQLHKSQENAEQKDETSTKTKL